MRWYWYVIILIAIISAWYAYKRYRDFKASNKSITLDQYMNVVFGKPLK